MKRSYYEAIILRRNHIVIDIKRKSIIMIFGEIRFGFTNHCSGSYEGRRSGDDGLAGRRCHDWQEWLSDAEIWPRDTEVWPARQMAGEADAGRRGRWPARQMLLSETDGWRDRRPARQILAGQTNGRWERRWSARKQLFSLFFLLGLVFVVCWYVSISIQLYFFLLKRVFSFIYYLICFLI